MQDHAMNVIQSQFERRQRATVWELAKKKLSIILTNAAKVKSGRQKYNARWFLKGAKMPKIND